ncbi:hypothetical protein F5Y15DRAFT_412262 [Xylariaceae sp. FL0016]|nr:hypothetical protein F5Y15DRAFT_412262 [Xylariaceae sp. FL0016]
MVTPRIQAIIGEEAVQRLMEKRAEYYTPVKLYCPRPGCAAFVPVTHRVSGAQGGSGTCPKCDARICLSCGGLEHEGACSVDAATAQVMAMANSQGWARCYRCRHLVMKSEGCNRMSGALLPVLSAVEDVQMRVHRRRARGPKAST